MKAWIIASIATVCALALAIAWPRGVQPTAPDQILLPILERAADLTPVAPPRMDAPVFQISPPELPPELAPPDGLEALRARGLLSPTAAVDAAQGSPVDPSNPFVFDPAREAIDRPRSVADLFPVETTPQRSNLGP